MVQEHLYQYNKKYEDPSFINKYVGFWAYGYQNSIGFSEGLYRAINELGFVSLDRGGDYEILDVGCGVGRTSMDYAKFFTKAKVVGIDDADLMIGMAERINTKDTVLQLDMKEFGFDIFEIECKSIPNITFQKISFEKFYTASSKKIFDIITAVNVVDRVDDVEKHFKMIYDLLKPGGFFIFSTPLNFNQKNMWQKYGSYKALSDLAKDVGFLIKESFDNFVYKELLDKRGAVEEYPTVVMKLTKY